MTFIKGNIPHNKGLKGWVNSGAFKKGSKPTGGFKNRFKKGHKMNVGKKHPLTVEHREKIKLGSPKGEKHYNWKGGITPINKKLRDSSEYKLWRKKIFERDNWTCVWCKDNKGGNLQAHHIKSWAKYPELRYEINNGITLCDLCHSKTDNFSHRKIL